MKIDNEIVMLRIKNWLLLREFCVIFRFASNLVVILWFYAGNSVGGGAGGSFKGAEVEQSPRRKTSRNYFEPQFKEKFQEAVKLVTSGKASILKAAKLCGIPKSTLYLRLKEMGISSSETPYQQQQQLQNGNSQRSPP